MDATPAADAAHPGAGTADSPVFTRTQRLWLDGGGLLHAECLPGAEQTQADAEECIASLWEIAGRRRPILVDLRRLKTMDRGARTYYAGPETARVESAAALLCASPLTRAIGNFFMGLNKPLIPTRLFTSEPEAIAWLQPFVV
jgi:hypothetical protein